MLPVRQEISAIPMTWVYFHQARVKTEKIIDILYEPLKGQLEKKPKTYRNLARKNYLQVAKKRRPSRKQRRSKPKKMREFVMVLKENLEFPNVDLA
jgi:hypothetical protein